MLCISGFFEEIWVESGIAIAVDERSVGDWEEMPRLDCSGEAKYSPW